MRLVRRILFSCQIVLFFIPKPISRVTCNSHLSYLFRCPVCISVNLSSRIASMIGMDGGDGQRWARNSHYLVLSFVREPEQISPCGLSFRLPKNHAPLLASQRCLPFYFFTKIVSVLIVPPSSPTLTLFSF